MSKNQKGWFFIFLWIVGIELLLFGFLALTDAWEKKDVNFFFTAISFALTMLSGSDIFKRFIKPVEMEHGSVDIFTVVCSALAVSYFYVYWKENHETDSYHITTEFIIFGVALLLYIAEIIYKRHQLKLAKKKNIELFEKLKVQEEQKKLQKQRQQQATQKQNRKTRKDGIRR